MGNSIGAHRFGILLLLLVFTFVSAVSAADSMFRANPEHTGVYEDGGIMPTNSELWRFRTENAVSSSPTVANGIVYIGDGSDLCALDAVSGTKKWMFSMGGSSTMVSDPAVSNGVVYVGSGDNNLYAINAVTGTEKWRFPTGNWIFSSPTVANGIVYIGSGDDNLYAINAVTGTEKWRFRTGSTSGTSPAVSNGIVYIGSEDHNLYAIDAVTGTEKWRFATRSSISSSPAVANGVVYIGSTDYDLYAIDAATGTKKWQYSTQSSLYSSPAVANDVVYIGSSEDKILYAVDAGTGKEKWRFSTGSWVHSSPAVANGIVYIGGGNSLFAINAATGAEQWIFETGSDVGSSSPVVANGVVYIGGGNNLYAIGQKPSTPIPALTVASTPEIISTLSSPSPSTRSFNSIDPLSIVAILFLLCICGIGYIHIRHSRNSGEDINDTDEEPKPTTGVSRPVEIPAQKSSPESIPPGPSTAILDRITATEKNAMSLNLFRAPVDELLSLSRQYNSSGKHRDAEHVLKKAESATEPLRNCEYQLLQWKKKGYDTTSLEILRNDVPDKIHRTFREFENSVEQLEKVRTSLEVLKRKYPAVISQAEFRSGISSLEQNLKKPDRVSIAQSELERLGRDVEEYTGIKNRREQHLQNQVKKIQQDISDESLMNEIKVIMKSIRTRDLSDSEQLFRDLISRRISQFNETIASLKRDGVVIPVSVTQFQQKAEDEEFGDFLIETSRKLGELDRIRAHFTEATALKETITDTRLLALYEKGEYEQVIIECKNHINSQKKASLIFISAKSEDFGYAAQVYNFLNEKGYKVFFSQQTLPNVGNSDYRKEIDSALDGAKHMLVVTSKKEHVISPWVEAEWGLFINEKRSGRKQGNIITLIAGSMRIEDLPSSLRYYEVRPLDPITFDTILNYLY
jgi:outer membrane protein assembly factor BamB